MSDYPVSFHYVNQKEMFQLEYFVYHMSPFGILADDPLVYNSYYSSSPKPWVTSYDTRHGTCHTAHVTRHMSHHTSRHGTCHTAHVTPLVTDEAASFSTASFSTSCWPAQELDLSLSRYWGEVQEDVEFPSTILYWKRYVNIYGVCSVGLFCIEQGMRVWRVLPLERFVYLLWQASVAGCRYTISEG